jgi:hypothetical protein
MRAGINTFLALCGYWQTGNKYMLGVMAHECFHGICDTIEAQDVLKFIDHIHALMPSPDLTTPTGTGQAIVDALFKG